PLDVLAAVVARALADGQRARVAHAEPLADDAADEQLARGGPVADDVARDDVLLGRERGRRVGAQREPPARQALAEVVVAVADQPQGDAPRHERAEALAGRAGERDVDRVVGQALAAPAPGAP